MPEVKRIMASFHTNFDQYKVSVFPGGGQQNCSAGGTEISVSKVVTGNWPTSVFFIVLATTFLFGIATLNGTTQALSKNIVCLARGNAKILPVIFFIFGAIISAAGAGGLIVAVIMPIALFVAVENGISVLMMSLVTMGGIMVGGLSPLAINGIVAQQLSVENGIIGESLSSYLPLWGAYAAAMTIFSIGAYFLLGGLHPKKTENAETPHFTGFDKNQTLTLAAILVVLVGVIVGTNGVVISPLSTVGGICVGCAPESVDKDKLYNELLLAAVSFIVMSVVLSFIGVFRIFG